MSQEEEKAVLARGLKTCQIFLFVDKIGSGVVLLPSLLLVDKVVVFVVLCKNAGRPGYFGDE